MLTHAQSLCGNLTLTQSLETGAIDYGASLQSLYTLTLQALAKRMALQNGRSQTNGHDSARSYGQTAGDYSKMRTRILRLQKTTTSREQLKADFFLYLFENQRVFKDALAALRPEAQARFQRQLALDYGRYQLFASADEAPVLDLNLWHKEIPQNA